MAVLGRPVAAEARLRAKNQLTVPETIVDALHAEPNDTFVWETDPSEPGVARVHRIPHDFAGSLTGVYGTSEEVLEFVRGEHAAWEE
jgi:hypothetical protein